MVLREVAVEIFLMFKVLKVNVNIVKYEEISQQLTHSILTTK